MPSLGDMSQCLISPQSHAMVKQFIAGNKMPICLAQAFFPLDGQLIAKIVGSLGRSVLNSPSEDNSVIPLFALTVSLNSK